MKAQDIDSADLIDYFAAEAMHALITALGGPPADNPSQMDDADLSVTVADNIARHAYLYAAAMLKARGRLMSTPNSTEAITKAWTAAIQCEGISGASTETLIELRRLREEKTTWFGAEENRLRRSVDAYLRKHTGNTL